MRVPPTRESIFTLPARCANACRFLRVLQPVYHRQLFLSSRLACGQGDVKVPHMAMLWCMRHAAISHLVGDFSITLGFVGLGKLDLRCRC